MGPGTEFVSWAAAWCHCLITAISLAWFLSVLSRTLWGLFSSWHVLDDITCQEPFPAGSVGKALLLFPSTLTVHRTSSQQVLHPQTPQMPSCHTAEQRIHALVFIPWKYCPLWMKEFPQRISSGHKSAMEALEEYNWEDFRVKRWGQMFRKKERELYLQMTTVSPRPYSFFAGTLVSRRSRWMCTVNKVSASQLFPILCSK